MACTASGAIVARRVWEVGEVVVYLCTDSCYEELQVGARPKPAIGFPRRDVFRINDEMKNKANNQIVPVKGDGGNY